MSVLPLIVDFATEKKNQYDGKSTRLEQSPEINANDNMDV